MHKEKNKENENRTKGVIIWQDSRTPSIIRYENFAKEPAAFTSLNIRNAWQREVEEMMHI